MLVQFSIHGVSGSHLQALPFSLKEARQIEPPEPVPSSWDGAILWIDDGWAVPLDLTVVSDSRIRESLWLDLQRRLARHSGTKSLVLTDFPGSIGESAEAALLLERPQNFGFALRREHLAEVAALAVPDDPWWPGLLQLAGADRVTVLHSDVISSTAHRIPKLVPDRPPEGRRWLGNHLGSGSLLRVLPAGATSVDEAALRAGLLIWHDFLDEGHAFAQEIEGEPPGRGDHWHAIMHRREADYGNSKYWYRRVPRPAWFAEMAEAVRRDVESPDLNSVLAQLATSSGWDPFAFVDLCQSIRNESDSIVGASPLEWRVRGLQRMEMTRLLADCLGRQYGP